MDHQNKPPINENCKNDVLRYSVPVLSWDKDGNLNPNLICWDYFSEGWVNEDLNEGPDCWDYDIECSVWALPPDKPSISDKSEKVKA